MTDFTENVRYPVPNLMIQLGYEALQGQNERVLRHPEADFFSAGEEGRQGALMHLFSQVQVMAEESDRLGLQSEWQAFVDQFNVITHAADEQGVEEQARQQEDSAKLLHTLKKAGIIAAVSAVAGAVGGFFLGKKVKDHAAVKALFSLGGGAVGGAAGGVASAKVMTVHKLDAVMDDADRMSELGRQQLSALQALTQGYAQHILMPREQAQSPQSVGAEAPLCPADPAHVRGGGEPVRGQSMHAALVEGGQELPR